MNNSKIFPSTSHQLRLFIDYKLNPNTSKYNLSWIIDINGKFNLESFQKSWIYLIQNQESFRTTFKEENDKIYQIIHPKNIEIPIEIINLNQNKNPKKSINKIVKSKIYNHFNLENFPLCSCSIIQFNQNQFKIVFCFHHIIIDGYSIDLFFNNLSLLYSHFKSDPKSQNIELNLDSKRNLYSHFKSDPKSQNIELNLDSKRNTMEDYLKFEEKLLQKSSKIESAENYWKDVFKDSSLELKIPTCYHYNKDSFTESAKRIYFHINKQEMFSIENFIKQYKTTLFIYLVSVFQVLLFKFSKQKTITVGYSSGMFYRKIFPNLIGFFVNNLPLKSKFKKDLSFLHLLSQNQNMRTQTKEFEWLPLSEIIKLLRKDENFVQINATNLYSVSFSATNFAMNVKFEDVETKSYPGEIAEIMNKLSFIYEKQNDSICFGVEYNTSIFSLDFINQLITCYCKLISSTSQNPNLLVSEYLSTFDDSIHPNFDYSTNLSQNQFFIFQKFEAQVQKQPDSIALIYQNQSITYKNLNKISNKLAHFLRDYCQVKPNTFVGICLDRSFELIIAILSVLKSGACYVALDPIYPQERLNYFIKDTKINTILTFEKYSNLIPNSVNYIIFLDNFYRNGNGNFSIKISENSQKKKKVQLSHISKDNPKICNELSDLAYIIYTSGSTGEPKGVMISHSNLSYRIDSLLTAYCINQDEQEREKEIFLHQASYSFDTSIKEIFIPLTTGGEVVILPQSKFRDINLIFDLIWQHSVTTVNFVPSLLEIFLKYFLENKEAYRLASSLKRIISGGEELKRNVVDLYFDLKLNSIKLFNGYGPTETTIIVTSYRIDSKLERNEKILIGKTIPHTSIYILDSKLNLVPIFAPGEIYVSGKCVSQGYINKEELTKKKFIPNPFSKDDSNKILYRTGDQGRFMKNGGIEFLGRVDNQIKLRGIRIELMEIETVLNKHPNIVNSVVCFLKEKQILVAFIIYSQDSQKIENQEIFLERKKNILNYLKPKLHQAMIPSIMIFLDSFPLTVGKKIDRGKLMKMAQDPNYLKFSKNEELNDEKEEFKPRNEIEKQIESIWKDILHIDNCKINDNFFSLGGHSLSVLLFASRIRNIFQINLPIDLIFRFPTIMEISELIKNFKNQNFEDEIFMIEKFPNVESPYPLSFAQERLLFLEELSPGNYNISIPIKLNGELDIEALEYSFTKLLKLYPIFGSRILMKNDNYYQEFIENRNFQIERSVISSKEVDQIIRKESSKHFDLFNDFLYRVKLFCIIDNENEKQNIDNCGSCHYGHNHLLLICVHHIIFDGFSHDIMNKKISSFYNFYIENKEKKGIVSEEELNEINHNLNYIDFILSQKNWFKSEKMNKYFEYWKQKLSGSSFHLNLPFDFPRKTKQSFKGSYYEFGIDQVLFKKLKNFAEKNNTTMFVVMLSVFQILLYRYSNQNDIIVGVPFSSRHYSGSENIIGLFVNSIPIITKFDEHTNQSFNSFLREIQKIHEEAHKYQDLPFDKIVRLLNIAHNPSHNPLFQVMFSYEHLKDRSVFNLKNVKSQEIYDADYQSSKFDLSLECQEINRESQNKEDITFTFAYSVDLFRKETIIQMANNLTNLIEYIVKNEGNESIFFIPLLSEKEKEKILYTFNYKKLNKEKKEKIFAEDEKLLHKIFEKITKEKPKNIALNYLGKEITYQQLNENSNQFAVYLINKYKIIPNSLIAIGIQRSIPLIIAIIGILKAGCCFLPIDVNLPQESLINIIKDSECKSIIINEETKSKFSFFEGNFINIDSNDIWEQKENINYEEILQKIEIDGKSLAYVIYTSGTSGKPKGVMIQHQAITLRLLSVQKLFGGTVVIGAENIHFDIPQLLEIISSTKVSVIEFVPSYLQVFLENHNIFKDKLKSLRIIICGGEALKYDIMNKFFKIFPENVSFYNAYGPTEITIDASYWKCDKNSDRVFIGKPLAKTYLYILDQFLQPVPIGVWGQLFVGGIGLSKGYLNNPDLTKKKFIANPFSKNSEKRLYKTGDIVRFNHEGNVEFFGRKDSQIKLRGYRIEISGIESIIQEFPYVSQAAIKMFSFNENDYNSCYLTAYIVTKKPEILEKEKLIEELKKFVSNKLPKYMVPSFYVILNELPLNQNGKIEYNLLEKPKINEKEIVKIEQEILGEMEKKMISIWQKILGIEEISFDSNFFELGGNSLILLSLQSKINMEMKEKIPINQFFMNQTPRKLVEYINSIHNIQNLESEIITNKENNENFGDSTIKKLISEDLKFELEKIDLKFDLEKLKNPDGIFLTGATGFLGSFLLFDLLKQFEQQKTPIYCLVRANENENGKQKIERIMKENLIWKEEFKERIIAIEGDLSKTNLGMEENEFNELSKKVSLIYHCGATVSYIYPYEKVRNSNILSTKEIIKLSCLNQLKAINYISTISVLTVYEEDYEEIDEAFPLYIHNNLYSSGGYTQTKTVSELLILKAKEKGIPIKIYRPSRIMGDSLNNCYNEKDFLVSFIKGVYHMKITPDIDLLEDCLPVDFVSQSIVSLSIQSDLFGQVFHLFNSQKISWNEIISIMNSNSLQVSTLSYKEWRKFFVNSKDDDLNPLSNFWFLFDENGDFFKKRRENFKYLNKKTNLKIEYLINSLKDLKELFTFYLNSMKLN
ncbi:hypothetical protein M0811_14704 [Anaeramoeba ignava]|uniref:Carrier domain-containing protein n=1 Tax=Anaeramoeba ignava TaxID=1746090 RepID=A0A9Q0LU74_ANAIG|nr:hypothetical protein M0811_14704 [Anaeramoeba ignava]